jgi:hypothetical protein
MTSAAPHLYIESDIPEGMTIAEWRRRRHVPRPTSRLRRLVRV